MIPKGVEPRRVDHLAPCNHPAPFNAIRRVPLRPRLGAGLDHALPVAPVTRLMVSRERFEQAQENLLEALR